MDDGDRCLCAHHVGLVVSVVYCPTERTFTLSGYEADVTPSGEDVGDVLWLTAEQSGPIGADAVARSFATRAVAQFVRSVDETY